MAADFKTNLQMTGTTEEILSMLQVFKQFKSGNKVYFDSVTIKKTKRVNSAEIQLNDVDTDDLSAFIVAAKNKIYITAEGPYGRFGFLDEIPLFMLLAEAAPNASFSGEMSGFSPTGDQKISGTLSEENLIIKTLLPCGGEEAFDEEGFFDEEEFNEFEDDCEEIQKFIYIDGKWELFSSDEIAISIGIQLNNGEKYETTLKSELADNLRFICLPERILETNSPAPLIQLLVDSLASDTESDAILNENSKKLTELEQSIIGEYGISSVRLTRTIRADDEFFSGIFAEDRKLVKLAKNVVKSKGLGTSAEDFLNYIKEDDISIPYFEWLPEWPNFCGIGRIEDNTSPDQGEWNSEVSARIQWENIASDILAFAELCAKDSLPDNSYAVETIIIDYEKQECSQTAVFYPGGAI